VDLIAKRFEARYLETEGKLPQALALCRDILAHFEPEPASEDLFPVYLKASELSLKLGDRPGGIALLVRAAEHFADHGIAPPIIDLCQRLPRLDSDLTRLHLRFARRMLERGHVTAACEVLRDLAVRRKKTALRQTLERMATWPEPIVRGQLLDFLDRAEARQRALTDREIPDLGPEPEQPEPVPPPRPPPPVVPSRSTPPPTEPTRLSPVPPVPQPPLPPPDVEFVEPPRREPRPSPHPVRTTPVTPLVPAPRRHRRPMLPWAGVAAAGGLVAAGVWLGAQLAGRGGEVVSAASSAPPAVEPAPSTAAMPDTGVPTAAGLDSVMAETTVPGTPVAPPAPAPAPAVTAAPAATVAAPAPRPTESAARPVVPEPDPPAPVDTRPAVLRVDHPLVMVEGLEPVRVGIEGEGAARRIVVLQLLPGGDTLELRAADLGAGSLGVGGGRILVSPHPAGGTMGTARVGQFLVTARASIAPDVLEPLLRRLVEVRP
jgi:hypothetical protein